jgi:ABC-type multidrug transport system fused ATPase/permease subunit
VIFAYPSNPRRKILKKISFKPLKNKFNALVGVTGSGKSTVTQLILKFYNDFEG